jgi:hypothetical protein
MINLLPAVGEVIGKLRLVLVVVFAFVFMFMFMFAPVFVFAGRRAGGSDVIAAGHRGRQGIAVVVRIGVDLHRRGLIAILLGGADVRFCSPAG